MILLLSPSKNMKDCAYDNKTSQPVFINEAKSLVNELNKMNISEIQDFMEISEKLAHLNFQRFQNWSLPFNKTNSSPAIYSFSGDVYEGLTLIRRGRCQICTKEFTHIIRIIWNFKTP